MIKLDKISKQYDGHKALDEVSFEIKEGIIFGMLGPNGAGKTTTIRCITQILQADSGSIFFDGELLQPKHTALIGYMPEERGLYKKMNVADQLVYLAQLKNLSASKADEQCRYWLHKLNIWDWRNKKVQDLSKGMQQKIQFIATVINNPKLLILDEPFSGLDPVNAQLIQDEIFNLKKQGTTIIFSTHRMEQVEEICDEIILINKGKNILEGTVSEIKHNYKKNQFAIEAASTLSNVDFENAPFNIINQNKDEYIIELKENSSNTNSLQWFINNQFNISKFNEVLPSIGQIFIQLVNSNQHD